MLKRKRDAKADTKADPKQEGMTAPLRSNFMPCF